MSFRLDGALKWVILQYGYSQGHWNGSSRNFVPDYLIRLKNGQTLVLEVKGQDSEQNRAKRAAMDTWIKAVNEQGGFGSWCFATVFDPSQVRDVFGAHSKQSAQA